MDTLWETKDSPLGGVGIVLGTCREVLGSRDYRAEGCRGSMCRAEVSIGGYMEIVLGCMQELQGVLRT